ncbi:Uncharacterised protein [Klebsiella pneumoniae]|uniref:Uncharacterized protein n=1 Tax=Klebsiella pneumoniae TaxID=573 RepID=A0A3S4HPW1_KLEPN|nr:Uncharacterised protein [Klebsiella pneumoniae]
MTRRSSSSIKLPDSSRSVFRLHNARSDAGKVNVQKIPGRRPMRQQVFKYSIVGGIRRPFHGGAPYNHFRLT